jgi:hypothetical protein
VSKNFNLSIAASSGCFLLLVSGTKTIHVATAQVYSPNITPGRPLVILLDNSGSMGKCSAQNSQGQCIPNAETPYRIDVVREAVRRRLTQSDLVSTKIGLSEIGDYKSYGLSQDKRCQALRPLLSPVLNSHSQVIDALDRIHANDDGVTPIAYALVTDLDKNGSLPARVLLITDGQPNCNEDFLYKHLCRLVSSFASSGVEFKLDIIGYKAHGKDGEFIECASKYPQMLNYLGSASTPSELDQKINKSLPTMPGTSSNNGTSEESNKWWVQIIAALIATGGAIFIAVLQLSPGKKSKKEKFIGRVLDAKTEKAIKGAKISLEGGRNVPKILHTDSEGVFTIDRSTPVSRIRVEADSYEQLDRLIDSSTLTEIEEIRLYPSGIHPLRIHP